MLAKKLSNKKVLDLYATAVKCKQAKLAKRSAKKREQEHSSDSKSDGEMSVNTMAITKSKSHVKSASECKTNGKSADSNEEEAAYQKKLQWLQDHREELVNEKTEKVSNQKPTNSSSKSD